MYKVYVVGCIISPSCSLLLDLELTCHCRINVIG